MRKAPASGLLQEEVERLRNLKWSTGRRVKTVHLISRLVGPVGAQAERTSRYWQPLQRGEVREEGWSAERIFRTHRK